MRTVKKVGLFHASALLTLFALSAGAQSDAEDADEADAESGGDRYVETVIVTGERGEVNALDRPMTVTGFNAEMIEQLGIQNTDDLEVLVPGLQVGNRSQGAGKNEDDHYYMRGLGSERTVNFFSDTSVAVYVDGVFTDQTFGIDGGLFDVERVEVARGPQGTTGGRSAIAGSINFHTRKPTEEFDLRTNLEMTDISTQRAQVAFGGPLGDTGFAYRLGLSSYTGDGRLKNHSGPDGMKPDELIVAPQLRWKNDRWDVNVKYQHMRDTGTPNASIPLGPENTLDEFILGPNGEPLCAAHPITGEEVCQRNPYFGVQPAPAVAGCSNINQDGTRDPMNIICDPDELRWEVAFNTPIARDSTHENFALDVVFALSDDLSLNYKFGWHDVINSNTNDGDQRDRVGGGVCPFNHPGVLSGMLREGATDRTCALDGGGVGLFADHQVNYIFSSEQTSHEITLVSNFDGPLNFTVGANTLTNDEPYVWRPRNFGSSTGDWLFQDTSASCNANIEALYGEGGSVSGGDSWLLRDLYSNPATMERAKDQGTVWACPGSPELLAHTGLDINDMFAANLAGQTGGFYGGALQEARGIYFNLEYVYNETWTFFGGIRRSDDKKDRDESSGSGIEAREIADPSVRCDSGVSKDELDFCENGFALVNLSVRDSSVFPARGDLKWGKTTWNIGTEYRPIDDIMIYGRIATGFRAGGSSGFSSDGPYQYDGEELINYEVGVKGIYLDGSLQLSTSYFYQDFDAHWVFAQRIRTEAERQIDPDGGPFTSETTGVQGSVIQGIEVEGAWRLTDQLTVRGFYNYLDTAVGDYPALLPFPDPTLENATWVQIPWVDSEGNTRVAWLFGTDEPTQLGGNQLPNQPKHKTSLTVAYDVDLPERYGDLELLTIANYRSKKYVEPANFDAYAVGAYTRWDARATWRAPNGKLEVTGYVQNLLDQAALHMWSPREGVGSPWGTIVEPREFGIIVSWRNNQ